MVHAWKDGDAWARGEDAQMLERRMKARSRADGDVLDSSGVIGGRSI